MRSESRRSRTPGRDSRKHSSSVCHRVISGGSGQACGTRVSVRSRRIMTGPASTSGRSATLEPASAAALLWHPGPNGQLLLDRDQLLAALARTREPLRIVHASRHGLVAATGGLISAPDTPDPVHAVAHRGTLPALYPEWLGDRSFAEAHACRFPYIVGEMARGIATPRMVIEAARAGLMGFYGSAGLDLAAIAAGLTEIKAALREVATNWGANLIHTPGDAAMEMATVALFQAEHVPAVSA